MKRWVAVIALIAVIVAGCGGTDDENQVVVFAASSLSDAFEVLATEFEAANPGVEVQLNLASSSALREQILSGAPADVFASANTATMDEVVGEGVAATAPAVFARNRLMIATPADNPGAVSTLDDLEDDDLFVGVCAATVPCGTLAVSVFSELGVSVEPDTREPNVRALLAKVVAGELDAGLVYASDVLTAGADVRGIDLPAAVDATAAYPITTLVDAGPAASSFVDFVRSDAGVAILLDHGFLGP